MMMHTPWYFEADEREGRGIVGFNIYDANGCEVVGEEGITDETSERAAFIVHVVNSHADLLAALKRMLATFGHSHPAYATEARDEAHATILRSGRQDS